MKGDIVMWMSGRGIKDEDWDRIFGKKEDEPLDFKRRQSRITEEAKDENDSTADNPNDDIVGTAI